MPTWRVASASVPEKPDTAGTEACATAWGFDDVRDLG
jgi:hypothetical protein